MQNLELSIVPYVIVLSLACFGLYFFRIYRAIAKTPTSPIGELGGGVREVKGRWHEGEAHFTAIEN